MPDEPQNPPQTDERSEQRRAAESLRQEATEKVQGEANAVRYGVYAYTWGPDCAQGRQQMTYPTLPPWCNPPQTFPPICPPANAAGGGGGGFVGTMMPTMSGLTCPCPPAAGGPTPTATFPPVCGDPAQAAAQMPTIYPAYTCGFVCNTLYPPCGEQQGWGGGEAQAAQVGAPQLNITLLGRTCPLVNCATLVARTCFCPRPTLFVRTCPVPQCGPTLSGFTCPQFLCLPTLQGITCPEWQCPQPTLATQSCDTFRCPAPTVLCAADAVGAATPPPISITCFPGACPTAFQYSCPGSGCPPQEAVGAPALAPPPIGPVTLTARTCLAIACQPTLFGLTCPDCPPTVQGSTCPLPVCRPTIVGNTCPRIGCQPTLFGNTCPFFHCRPTLFTRTCPIQFCHPTLNPQCVIDRGPVLPGPQQEQVGAPGLPIAATLVGQTCPILCHPTLMGQTCPYFVCHPIQTVTARTCPAIACLPTLTGQTCPINHCFPTITGSTCPHLACFPIW